MSNKLAPSESSTSDGAKSLHCPLDYTSLYFSLVHSTSSVLYRGLWTGFVFDQWLLFKTPSCSSSYLLPLVSWIECGAWVASYLNLCSLWTIPPILKFRLGILSFPLFVLSCFVVEFNISLNYSFVNIFFKNIFAFFILSFFIFEFPLLSDTLCKLGQFSSAMLSD